ncbi:MAG TPA: alpha/beta fold hydrolase [Acidimicrobiales bacterium]|jgi:carboxymethylenebutenolidase|nr:alpha/beta fold hydrolase [Acidimicrobiales bacterium]
MDTAGTAYLVAPDAGSGPGVLLLHSWWGLTPFFRSVADRLADEGFVVLAPDLMGGALPSSADEAQRLLAESDPNEGVALVTASAARLRNLRITPDGPIAVVGFSMGASWALWLSARAPDVVAATVVFYGSQNIDFDGARSAYLGHFAEHDPFESDDDIAFLEASLGLAGCDVTFHRYAGTGHWFFESDRPDAFDADAAEQAWSRTVEFLRAHLA